LPNFICYLLRITPFRSLQHPVDISTYFSIRNASLQWTELEWEVDMSRKNDCFYFFWRGGGGGGRKPRCKFHDVLWAFRYPLLLLFKWQGLCPYVLWDTELVERNKYTYYTSVNNTKFISYTMVYMSWRHVSA